MSASEMRPDSRLLGSDGWRTGIFVTVSTRPPLPSGRGELEQIQIPLGHMSVQTMERYLGWKQPIHNAVDDRIGLEQSKSAVLNCLTSPSSQRTYGHAITGHTVWSTAFIRSSFIRPPCTSILERAVSISRRSAGVS